MRIAVGVDGSAESRHALRWAVTEARTHDAMLEAVAAWSVPYESGLAWGYGVVGEPDVEHLGASAAEALEALIREELGDAADIEVTPVVVQGHPANVLLDRSREVDLLVVGSRGRGGFTRMLLGSTSSAVVAHAHCPTVVVPSEEHSRERR